MALEQINIVDKIEVVENGSVQVRVSNRVVDGTTLIAESFSRHVIAPGQDYSKEDVKVQAICAAVHTSETVSAYKKQQDDMIAQSPSSTA